MTTKAKKKKIEAPIPIALAYAQTDVGVAGYHVLGRDFETAAELLRVVQRRLAELELRLVELARIKALSRKEARG